MCRGLVDGVAPEQRRRQVTLGNLGFELAVGAPELLGTCIDLDLQRAARRLDASGVGGEVGALGQVALALGDARNIKLMARDDKDLAPLWAGTAET